MSDAISHAEQIASRACEHWRCITSVPQLFMHRENTVFKVETPGGAAALRVHRHGYHSRAAIDSELQWMAHLASHGLQMPAPIVNLQNSYLTEIEDRGKVHIVDLLTWVEGAPLGNSTDPLAFDTSTLRSIFYNLGCCIAQMHMVSDHWTIPAGFVRHAWDREGFVGKQAFWGAFWEATGITDAERHVLMQARAKAGTELDALRDAGADYGLIHADLVRQNILVAGTEVRIIDFDDSGFGFRMYDFATALVKNRAEPHFEVIRAALFEGYRSQRQLATRDEKSLDLFLTLRDLAYLGWMEDRLGEPGVQDRMPGIRAAAVATARKFLAAPFEV